MSSMTARAGASRVRCLAGRSLCGCPPGLGEFATDARSYRQLLQLARQWPERIWAVEGANGIGRPVTQRLLASAERVLDVLRMPCDRRDELSRARAQALNRMHRLRPWAWRRLAGQETTAAIPA